MKMKKTKSNLLRDNSGIALISVIIVGLVCALIASIVLEITYTSLQSRKVYKASTKSNYEAESAVDDMESVVQNIAYYAVNKNSVDVSKSFISVASQTLEQVTGASLTNPSQVDYDKIADYIYSNLSTNDQQKFGEYNSETKLFTRNSSLFSVTGVTKDTDDDTGKLSISVSFTYEDADGFQSQISTDLVLNDITTRKAASDYSLGSYSMFTGGGVTFEGNNQLQNHALNIFRQEGNVYIGTMGSEAPTAMKITNAAVIFDGAAIINGDVYLNTNAVWRIDAGKDDSGNRTEVTIYGTVYIDKTSVLILNEDIDFMCKDIVIVDGSNQWSVFDSSKNAYVSSENKVYNGLYPFSVKDFASLTAAGQTTYDQNKIENDFYSLKTCGCLMITNGSNTYVAKNAGSSGWKKITGSGTADKSSILINQDPTTVPKAKTTIWTYDNQEFTVDAEMNTFVNCGLVYAWSKLMSNTGIHAHYAQLIGHDSASSVQRESLALSVPGGKGGTLTKITGYQTTSELVNAGKLKSNPSQGEYLSLNDIIGKTITLGTNNLNSIYFKVGVVQDCGENLNNINSAIMLICVWDAYTIQMNGGTLVGIAMSADKCQYKTLGSNCIITAYSILNAKDDASATAKTDIDNLMDELQYVTFSRSIGNPNGGGYNLAGVNWYEEYGLSMLDSLFVGGMKSFKGDGGGNSGGSVSVNTSNMYDFITIENWQTN